eukprot:16055214-Heterocapsa_arctica.AAC.1
MKKKTLMTTAGPRAPAGPPAPRRPAWETQSIPNQAKARGLCYGTGQEVQEARGGPSSPQHTQACQR